MSNLIAIVYPDKERALEVREVLFNFDAQHFSDVIDVALVTRSESGRVHLDQSDALKETGRGLVGGSLAGLLIGSLFLMPLAGAAIGGASGAIAGGAADVIDDEFMRSVGRDLKPRTAALFILVSNRVSRQLLSAIAPYGGVVVQSDLPFYAEEEVQTALNRGYATV